MNKTSLAVLTLLAVCACKNKTPDAQVIGGVETFCPDEHHPHLIDFGLPSGTLWSCCNLDADIPSDAGKFYAWGELDPKEEYTEQNYQLHDNVNGGFVNLHRDHIAMSEYDVVHKRWGQGWRLPSQEQFTELMKECDWEVCEQNGVKGLAISKGDKAIFMPVAGLMNGVQPEHGSDMVMVYGWTDMPVGDYSGKAYCLQACPQEDGSTAAALSEMDAFLGVSIRPVALP